MSLIDKLERIFGRIAIPNLSLYLVIGQVFVLLTGVLGILDLRLLVYVPRLVEAGQWWRPLTFMFLVPIPSSLTGYVFTVFGWYLFYLMGSALEAYWGVFRFNVFLFISTALTVCLAFFTPFDPVTNVFILGSVFLAFAYLNPDFEITLFFILPVKIKWLAMVTWAINTALFIAGDLPTRLQIGASIGGFLLFFTGDILRRLGVGRGTTMPYTGPAPVARGRPEPRHVCHVCGKTDLSHPDLDFRYCSKCAGDQCYCPEHLQNHTHVVATHETKQK